ncbi:MAG: M23 family metallopeptidase [Pseudomonadota bacterium]
MADETFVFLMHNLFGSKVRIALIVATICLVIIGIAILFCFAHKKCIVGQHGCGDGLICAKGSRPPFSQAYCVEEHQSASGVFLLPMDQPAGVICTQSGKNPNGSHGFINTLFALDLSSPLDSLPATIYAVHSGEVIKTNSECVDPGTAVNNADNCGDGFGNYVVIDHGDDVVSFYAHLASVSVKNRDKLKAGDKIGVEGITGQAGHRHLHFSIQQN